MKKFERDLITGGTGLSLGSTIIDKLPASQAQTNVQSGIAQAGSYYSPMVNISMGGRIISDLKKLNPKRRKK